MKIRFVLAVSLLCAVPAHAQLFPQQVSKVAVSGKPVILNRYSSVNPDCTKIGYMDIRVTQQPQNGRVQVIKAKVFPVYAPSNPRHVCNSRGVPGVEVRYISGKGFIGTDSVTVEAISPDGNTRNHRFTITVK